MTILAWDLGNCVGPNTCDDKGKRPSDFALFNPAAIDGAEVASKTRTAQITVGGRLRSALSANSRLSIGAIFQRATAATIG